MAKSGRVLSIDITNESITIVDISAQAKKQTYIHKVMIFETPEDSYEDGQIRDQERIAAEIRNQLASNGVTTKQAVFVMNSTKIVNREVEIPAVATKNVGKMINANAADYFPVNNIEDYVIEHSVLESFTAGDGQKKMRVMAVAAPESMVASYYSLAAAAGLKCQELDYIGNAMLQLIKTQTTEQSTTMVIQLGSESTVLNVVNGDKLLLQRTVPYGTNPVVNTVMQEKGVDATTAMTMLQNDKIITVDFDDNEATGAFRYLINNIGRVMDFYASKNPNNPIDDVFLTGDGALIKGIDGLFKIQLNVSTRIMDSLYNVKFDPTIDQRVYSPVYLISSIGGALAPMGFPLGGSRASAGGAGASTGGVPAIGIAACLIAALIAAGLVFYQKNKVQKLETKKAQLESDIAAIADIERIINEYEAQKAATADILNMSASTYEVNEQFHEFIDHLEATIPSDIKLISFAASGAGITLPCECASYDSIAQFIMNLKALDIVEDAYVASVTQAEDQETGEIKFQYVLTCNYTNPNAVEEVPEETGDIVTEEGEE
jgi:type IV pilus assembly protein PilM